MKRKILWGVFLVLFLVVPAFLFAAGRQEKSDSSTAITVEKGTKIADADGDLNPELVKSGDLLIYSYEETVTDFFLKDYKAKYPDINVKTAVYGELDEAIAKMRG